MMRSEVAGALAGGPTHSLYHLQYAARCILPFPRMLARRFVPFLSGAALIAVAALLYSQRSAVSQTLAADDSVFSFRMRLGVNDTEPRPWDGSLTVSGGQALRIRNWRPRPGDRIDGNSAWSLSSRKGLNFDR